MATDIDRARLESERANVEAGHRLPATVAGEVADRVYRLGDRFVDWYVVEGSGGLTIVDGGLPAHWSQLAPLLASLGRTLDDIVAVLLTHHHADHLGNVEHIRMRSLSSVLVHAADARGARSGGVAPPGRSLIRTALRPPGARYIAHVLASGGARLAPVADVRTFEDGERLDVPGRPRVVHTPGHTPGSCILVLEDRNVVFSGDAIVTYDPTCDRLGPRTIRRPFTANEDQATRSLDRIAATGMSILLPGHGEPWRQGVAEAVRMAQSEA